MKEVSGGDLVQLLRSIEAGAAIENTDARPGLARLRELGLVRFDDSNPPRLTHSLDWLDAAVVELASGGRDAPFRVSVVPVTGSTNDDVMQLAQGGAPAGLVRAAELQTAGRGRMGRSWLSTPCAALTFSVLWRFPYGAHRITALTLAVGVGLARALDDLGARDIQLKWPNDILFGDKKLCGVLVETAGNETSCAAVIGIGVNVRLPPVLAARIDQPATDLEAAGVRQTRNEMLSTILIRLGAMLFEFEREGFAAFRSAWDARHAYQGYRADIVTAGATSFSGRILGVNDDGALQIETAQGVRPVYSGEVRVQLAGAQAR